MKAIYFHPAGHKHTFRNVEAKNGKATLTDEQASYPDVPVSESPKSGYCVIIKDDEEEIKVSKPTKNKQSTN